MSVRITLALAAFFALFSPAFAQESDGPQTGQYTEIRTVASVIGETQAAAFGEAIKADHDIEFDVYVPPSYDPSAPAGIFVFISPSVMGEIPDDWKVVMDNRNLIWVSVNKSGNKVPALRRMAEAAISPSFIAQKYRVDPTRIYVSGFSGGGRVASQVATVYPDLFNGALFMCGVDPWEPNPPAMIDTIKNNRFVFLTGSEDFNRRMTLKAYGLYKDAGVEQIKLMVVTAMRHRPPGTSKFEEAVEFLDGVAE